jgi:hypothetical protein
VLSAVFSFPNGIKAGNLQGAELSFASMGAGGDLLQFGDSQGSSLVVGGHKVGKAHRWRYHSDVLVHAESGQPVPFEVHVLNVFAMEEVRAFVKEHSKVQADLEQQVSTLSFCA